MMACIGQNFTWLGFKKTFIISCLRAFNANKPNTIIKKKAQDYYAHCRYLLGHGKICHWILSVDFQPSPNTRSSWWWLTVFQKGSI